ncbi:hypothetical protein V5O48_007899 [Marasmius crinis-equi]|uniref:ABC transporter domain-containing protein n=1 Tax=Marasmius crinis-equi TaxID=585013 RepID=A0ABR3FFJ6_9AGAR
MLRNISLSYPEDSSTKKALDSVNFRIPSGQLVVIVGINGSGKSSFVSLLTWMYDVLSGQFFVDGEDIRTYKLSDFQRATASLTQNHRLLPLSIAENIAREPRGYRGYNYDQGRGEERRLQLPIDPRRIFMMMPSHLEQIGPPPSSVNNSYFPAAIEPAIELLAYLVADNLRAAGQIEGVVF